MNENAELWMYLAGGFIGMIAISIFWQLFSKPRSVVELDELEVDPVKIKQKSTTQIQDSSEDDCSPVIAVGYHKPFGADKQINAFNCSTLPIHFDQQLFMHFADIQVNSNSESNAEQAHKELFFWKHNEEFCKMSLPQEFASMNRRYFRVIEESNSITLSYETVIPWFDQPGGGSKYSFSNKGKDIAIQEVLKLGLIEYVVIRDVVSEGISILFDRENNFLWVDTDLVQFAEGKIYQNGREIDYATAFSIGALLILGKPTKL